MDSRAGTDGIKIIPLPKRPRRGLERALFAALAAVFFVIAAGTVWALFFRDKKDAAPAEIATPVRAGTQSAQEIKMFTGIGRLRIPLAPSDGADSSAPSDVAVVSVFFPYDSADLTFAEELASRAAFLREETRAFFTSLPHNSSLLNDEDALKAALLERYNSVLRLGKINALYFADYIVME